jgi:nitroimidazol reductase NimA-like FMN-containing flavoprotein (pyridoxamine 5'-phosphate oxidase superfamily)
MSEHPTDHAGLEVLPFEVCLQVLASVPVGRVGFFADGELVILPVNHLLDGQDVVFRTARGAKLSAAEGQDLVAFEVDEYYEQTQSAWSVVMTGRAEMVDDEADIERLSRRGLHPWASAVERPFWIRIRPTAVSGRRTTPKAP